MPHRADVPALLTGLMATLAGIGVARFAYTALLPAIIQDGWFGASQAAYLGAANLLGYLIGALSGHTLSERFPARRIIALSFAGIVLSFLLCAVPGSFAWFFVWRLVSGVAGAILMVVGPSLALMATAPDRRKTVGALVFTGIGLGALLSATIVPVLLEIGPTAAWLALGGLCLVAGVACDRGLAHLPARQDPAASTLDGTARHAGSAVVVLVIAAYALDAVGFVPHTVFWVDYLAREADLGTPAASLQWAAFGVGAILGPLVAGVSARHMGWQSSLALAYLLKATAVAIPLISIAFLPRTLSSLMVGAMIPGIVALTSGRLAELVGPKDHKRLWGRATAAFALAQALSGYGMSGLYDRLDTYAPLFALGSLALAVGLVLILLSPRMDRHAVKRPLSIRRP
ncbi:YbfB/YjiJ family MFS transporter [Roseospira visakhapatnamensis]|uniref:Putative MFS family arabinose efflux permease n=1 Tax=Roseospira visakhapatnamensis TaxID=390880 RepID=A0A7W6WA36_9PROT|nr:YbfB/YjiJ family MFS transporter [Roseospira visakhapatnamensis]MBB4266584.1 putative MFS family arabinose efflux permease [Roseospira visakhapatnamensis]